MNMQRYGEKLDDWRSPKPEEIPKSGTANTLFLESSRLANEKRYKEALTLINIAIENDEDNYAYHLKKAVILENLNRFEESAQAYDTASGLNDIDEIHENKARMLYKWANSLNDKQKALELIDEAIFILPLSANDTYFERFWYLKGSILDCLGRKIESRKCYMMAEGMDDEIRILDEQVETLNATTETMINITGTMFYHGMEPFAKGVILKLIREPDNPHDPDAIRVELEGETVGYVANNEHTLIENVKSASEIKDSNFSAAEVVMVYLDEYVIAKLIGSSS